MTADQLIQFRADHGYTRAALARTLGCDPHTLARWESGATPGPAWLGYALAALAYHLPPYR